MPSKPPGKHGSARHGQGRRADRGTHPNSGQHSFGQPVPAGYPVRAMAVRLVSAVLDRGRALDDALAVELATGPGAGLEPRDRGLARLIAATVLRRKGELEAVIGTFIGKPLPDDRGLLTPILLCAAAQLVLLEIAPHAVLNIAVEQCRRDRGARRFDRLANAVLRRTSERGREILAGLPGARLDLPDWMWRRWVASYGEATAEAIARASLVEAALDLSVRSAGDAADWAARLGGTLLPAGTIRLTSPGVRVEELPGFSDGSWWVQDAAAALPARLLSDVRGLHVADLCAAPGGKTAQLASAGAHVTAVDISPERLGRLRENLARLKLTAGVVAADVETWQPGRLFDAVLLDAPCTATGTIRRHPDIPHLKRATDLAPLVGLQARLLDRAVALLRPGGRLVYCTCSLEPEEGADQIERLLARCSTVERVPIDAVELPAGGEWQTPAGDLRTLPFHKPDARSEHGGMDGFYAARMRRIS